MNDFLTDDTKAIILLCRADPLWKTPLLSEKTSSGSLSPRTKWKSLAEFEFPLPPIERQKEILEVLEKLEENDLKLESSINSISTLLKCMQSRIAKGVSFN